MLMGISFRFALCLGVLICGTTRRTSADWFPDHGPTVPGKIAQLRCGIACAPAKAPQEVKRAIWAANELRGNRIDTAAATNRFSIAATIAQARSPKPWAQRD